MSLSDRPANMSTLRADSTLRALLWQIVVSHSHLRDKRLETDALLLIQPAHSPRILRVFDWRHLERTAA